MKFLTETVAGELITAVDGKPGTAIFFGASLETGVARIISESRVEAQLPRDLCPSTPSHRENLTFADGSSSMLLWSSRMMLRLIVAQATTVSMRSVSGRRQ
ncbi:hypothetical protein FMUBM48_08640 [Nocardia cyriacigeorgica]|nr:hypothetical protein FMUBM48_08640 [Nocardia cyriacigeorgica]